MLGIRVKDYFCNIRINIIFWMYFLQKLDKKYDLHKKSPTGFSVGEMDLLMRCVRVERRL